VVEFLPPVAGQYDVKADFEGIHFRLSSTDVHVRRNDEPLFDALIDGYGGDPAFHAVVGNNPDASYRGLVDLSVSDVLSFAVGPNGGNANDTTGLSVRITRLH
jgi:hypothetical protein